MEYPQIGKCLCLKLRQLQPRKGSGNSWHGVAKSNPLRLGAAEWATRMSVSWKKWKELGVLGQGRTAGPFFWFLFLHQWNLAKLEKRGIFLVFSSPILLPNFNTSALKKEIPDGLLWKPWASLRRWGSPLPFHMLLKESWAGSGRTPPHRSHRPGPSLKFKN